MATLKDRIKEMTDKARIATETAANIQKSKIQNTAQSTVAANIKKLGQPSSSSK